MEQIIVTILLVLAAIADWALFIYALDCDKAKQLEPRKAELGFYFSELVLVITLVASWLLKDAILASEWGIMWCVLLLVSVVFGAMACRLFDLQAERQKQPSEEG